MSRLLLRRNNFVAWSAQLRGCLPRSQTLFYALPITTGETFLLSRQSIACRHVFQAIEPAPNDACAWSAIPFPPQKATQPRQPADRLPQAWRLGRRLLGKVQLPHVSLLW